MKYFNTLNFTVNIYCKVCLPGPLQAHKNLAYTKECDFCTNEPIGRSRSHGSVGQFFVAIAGSVHLASGALREGERRHRSSRAEVYGTIGHYGEMAGG